MFNFEKTTLYKNTVKSLQTILKEINTPKETTTNKIIIQQSINLTDLVGQLVRCKNKKQKKLLTQECETKIKSIVSSTNFLLKNKKEKARINSILKELHSQITNFQKTQKNILILTAKFGHGHINAAKATKEGLRDMYGYDFNVEVIDFTEIVSPNINKATQKILYGSSKYTPKLNRLLYEYTDSQWPMKLLSAVNYPFLVKKIKKLFDEKQPSLIISTNSVWEHLIHEIWKKYDDQAHFINIITDSINVHASWIIAKPDFHIVANKETADSLKKLKVEPSRIKILGFPIQLKFLNTSSHKEFYEKQNLNPNKKTILYIACDDRITTASKYLKLLLSLNKYQTIVVTGRSHKMAPKLKEEFNSHNIKIFGWVDNLHQLIQHSDIIISKAGGSTVMEVIAMEKPIIITKILANQEEGNAELIKKHNLGVILTEKNQNIKQAIKDIEKELPIITNNLKKISKPKAALKIAKFIKEEILN